MTLPAAATVAATHRYMCVLVMEAQVTSCCQDLCRGAMQPTQPRRVALTVAPCSSPLSVCWPHRPKPRGPVLPQGSCSC
jgi:hypothetical protein